MPTTPTVVICAAGMGTRLGMGVPKSLLELHGHPLIYWQLLLLKDVKDVRVVIGFQAGLVANVVRAIRPDVTFVLNHDYLHSNTAASLYLGAQHTNNYVISFDGDLLVRPRDWLALVAYPDSVLGVTEVGSECPVLVTLDSEKRAQAFSYTHGDSEWTGLVKMPAKKISAQTNHVFEMLKPHLPMQAMWFDTCEIDTPQDYDRALSWLSKYQTEYVTC